MTLTCLLRMLPSWDDEMSPVLPSWDADMLLSMLAIFLSRLIRAWLSSSMSCSRPLSWLLYWPGPEYHTTTCSMAWKYIYLVTSNINHNPDASASYYLMACSGVCTFQPMVGYGGLFHKTFADKYFEQNNSGWSDKMFLFWRCSRYIDKIH